MQDIEEKDKLQAGLEKIIRSYFKEEFGNEDALPNLVLKGLAEEINKHRWDIHAAVQEEYDLEDIDYVAENNGIKLTPEERQTALHRYRKLEDSNLDTLAYIIDEIETERENSQSSKETE